MSRGGSLGRLLAVVERPREAPGVRLGELGQEGLSPVNIMDSGIADFYAASMASGSAWRALSKRSKNSCMASAGTRSPMDSCGRKRL